MDDLLGAQTAEEGNLREDAGTYRGRFELLRFRRCRRPAKTVRWLLLIRSSTGGRILSEGDTISLLGGPGIRRRISGDRVGRSVNASVGVGNVIH